MGNKKFLTAVQWMEYRRDIDGADGLWRIGNNLYDLSEWIHKHPGGSQWLEITKGTDITEAFESHHISTKAEEMLPKFWIRKAIQPRSYDYTFEDNGFYRVLKRRIREKLKDTSRRPMLKSAIFADTLVLVTFALALLSSRTLSATPAILAGLFLALSAICSHNFFHQRDNWRSYYFQLSLLSVKSWKITHILSHHIYTNTVNDLEIVLFEPIFQWLPKNKPWFVRKFSILYSPIIYVCVIPKELLQRIVLDGTELVDLIPLTLPLMMLCFGNGHCMTILILWILIVVSCSFFFVFIGVNAAHHHPDIYHDGDEHRKDKDWGLHQLDTVREKIEVKENTLLALITFGDHCLHHLFPSLDHALLPQLYPILEKTCKDFNIDIKMLTVWELMIGQYKQLIRTTAKSSAS